MNQPSHTTKTGKKKSPATAPHRGEYLVYIRKSTDKADNQKNSIAYQEWEALRYAGRNGIAIANYTAEGFSENGIIREKHTAFKTSGISFGNNGSIQYTVERPKFKTLITLLLKKQFLGVIFLCWDRASRNDPDEMIIKHLIQHGVDVRFVQTEYDKTSSGALHMDIDGMFSKHYSRVISEKVKAAYTKLRTEGKCTYMAPLGYLDEGVDNKPLDPERSPTVKRLFELYATGGWSLAQLAKWANQQGLTTKPLRRRRTPEEMLTDIDQDDIPKVSRPVNNKTVEIILNNPFYIGKLKTKDGAVEGIHRPLVDISLFNKVQEVLRTKQRTVYYTDKKFYTYRRLIHCLCGRAYTPYQKKGFTYYSSRCKAHCDNTKRNIRETIIDDCIETLLIQIHFSDQELQEIQAQSKTALPPVREKRNKEIDDLHTQQKRIQADLHYLKQNRLTLLRLNTMTVEEYSDEERKLHSEQQRIHEKKDMLTASEQQMLRHVLTFSELVKMANLYYKHALDTEKQEIAHQVFSELNLHNGKLANLTAKEGFAALLKRHDLNSGRPGWI